MDGEIYVADIVGGEIYKLTDASAGKYSSITDDPNTVLFPNPSNGQFNLKWIASENETNNIEIINSFGQQIFSTTLEATSGINTWSYSNAAMVPGSYICVIKSNTAAIRKQFIVNN